MTGASEEMARGEGKPVGHIIVNVNACLIGISTVIVFTRLYVRYFMIKAQGWDDHLVIFAFPLVVAVSCIEIVMVGHGAGSHIWTLSQEQLDAWFSLLPINALVGFLASCFVRLSILAFLPRLCINGAHKKSVLAASAVTIGTTLITFFVFLFACQPISETFVIKFPDLHCVASKTKAVIIWLHSIFGACLDIVLFGLPIWIVRTTMVFNPKAFKVILVFAFGLLAVITAIIKTCMLMTTDFSTDPTYKAIRVCTWTVVEIHIGLWCGSFPAIQPLLRLIWFKLKPVAQHQSIPASWLHISKANIQRGDLPGQGGLGALGGGLGREDTASGRAIATSGTDSTMAPMHPVEIKTGMREIIDILSRVEEGVCPREPNEAGLKWGPV